MSTVVLNEANRLAEELAALAASGDEGAEAIILLVSALAAARVGRHNEDGPPRSSARSEARTTSGACDSADTGVIRCSRCRSPSKSRRRRARGTTAGLGSRLGLV